MYKSMFGFWSKKKDKDLFHLLPCWKDHKTIASKIVPCPFIRVEIIGLEGFVETATTSCRTPCSVGVAGLVPCGYKYICVGLSSHGVYAGSATRCRFSSDPAVDGLESPGPRSTATYPIGVNKEP